VTGGAVGREMEFWNKELELDGGVNVEFARELLHSIEKFAVPLTCNVIRNDHVPENILVVVHCAKKNVIHVNKSDGRLSR
jgi:hypothetical protein